MVMDYAKNGSLFRYHSALLQNGTQPSSSQIYQFFYQALQALKYLHSNDLMHRDIKVQYSTKLALKLITRRRLQCSAV